jgi:cytochrome P450
MKSKKTLPKGRLSEYRKDPCGYIYQMFLEQGPHFRIQVSPGKTIYFLNDEEAVKKVLVSHNTSFSRGTALENAKVLVGESILTSDGKAHLDIRKVISKVYSKAYIARYEQEVERYMARYAESVQEGDYELTQFFEAISLDLISILLFGVEVKEHQQLIADLLNAAYRLIGQLYIPGKSWWLKTPFGRKDEFFKYKKELEHLIDQLISKREVSNHGYMGTIDLLNQAGLNREQIMAQVFALLLAGHETTATTMTWMVYAVLKFKPDIKDFLNECDQGHASGSRYKDLEQFPEIKAMMYETYRYRPAVWSIGRKVNQEIDISGFHFHPGDYIGLSPFIMHRHPEVFERMDEFWPKRWVQGDDFLQLRSTSFFPFSLGTRNCIGRFLAETELFSIMKTFFTRFHSELLTTDPVGLKSYISLRPDRPINVKLRLKKEQKKV